MPPRTTRNDQPEQPQLPVDVWVAGDGAKQVPVAGLLADDPTLRDAQLSPEEWEQKLADYLRSERP